VQVGELVTYIEGILYTANTGSKLVEICISYNILTSLNKII